MTDTTVLINGQPAGATHQGGFYRFSYDITRLVKPGRNEIEVRVSKESANQSVNHAERRGDYWTFGGIYRPVWLEARPRHHIAWTAIDARADGSFTARAHFERSPCRATRALRRRFIDAVGKPVGGTVRGHWAARQTRVVCSGRSIEPALWTAETPNLYTVKFTSRSAGKRYTKSRSASVSARSKSGRNDGVYLNGRKIVLKGVNRHSFPSGHGPHAHARAELRRRAAHQVHEHERRAHVALSTRSGLPRRGR